MYFTNPHVSALNGSVATNPVFPASMGELANYYPNPATAQFSLGVQHQVAPAVIAVLQYVGTTAWDQNDQRAINTLPLIDPTHPPIHTMTGKLSARAPTPTSIGSTRALQALPEALHLLGHNIRGSWPVLEVAATLRTPIWPASAKETPGWLSSTGRGSRDRQQAHGCGQLSPLRLADSLPPDTWHRRIRYTGQLRMQYPRRRAGFRCKAITGMG